MTRQAAWIGAITIDCANADELRRFYADALGGVDMPGFPQSLRVGSIVLTFRELQAGCLRPGPEATCRSTSRSSSVSEI